MFVNYPCVFNKCANKHIGSSLSCLFEELGETEEVERLLQEKLEFDEMLQDPEFQRIHREIRETSNIPKEMYDKYSMFRTVPKE